MQESQRELFNEDLLVQRLNALGLDGVKHVESHENQTVMVSMTSHSVLRVHRSFAYAPDSVLRAIVVFANPRTRSRRRGGAERMILAFPVEGFARPRSRRRRKPAVRREDRTVLRKLSQLHSALNDRFFDGALGRISFRISWRMQRKLGELTLDLKTDRPLGIAVSGDHIERDGWQEVEHTLLHEMIHQWQAENDLPVDHGAIFRGKAREVGIAPRAMRDVGRATVRKES